MYYLIGLERSDGSSKGTLNYLSKGQLRHMHSHDQQLLCLEVFKQEINCVPRVF